MDPNDAENPEDEHRGRSPARSEDPFEDELVEEEDGEDLIPDDDRNVLPMGDYQPMPHLDRYAGSELASQSESIDYSAEVAARRAAERQMDQRDVVEGRRTGRDTRLPDALHDDDDRPRRRRRTMDRAAAGDMEDEDDDIDGDDLELEKFDCPLKDWISQAKVERQIRKRFRRFLKSHGDKAYIQKIKHMCEINSPSLEVSYLDMSMAVPLLAIWVADCPMEMLPILHSTAKEVVMEIFPNYANIHKDIFVRVADLPLSDQIRDIRQSHLGALIRIGGVVTRRTGVFPQLHSVKYDCVKCAFVIGPLAQHSDSEVKMGSCPQCQSKGPFTVNVQETIYRNFQKITLQEAPGSVPAGRLPRSKEVILTNDLIDRARPGEEVEVTGIYTNSFDMALNVGAGFPIFSTVVEANYVLPKGDLHRSAQLTDEEKVEIVQLSKDRGIGRRIQQSIAPSIHGHEDIKLALALALFGGQEKHVRGKARLRGDINVLLLGDPGVAKSQFLKYLQKTGTRAVYTTGKGASAVGLTAAVHKDPITREWTLEGGALVLADRGMCLIDEFDKMNDQDRVSIHEAMEQQSISISKAGIVTSLQARCSVVAAANPIGGRYDPSKTFSENVELTDPILSRFDILLVVRDVVDPVVDERLASFVVGSHARALDLELGVAPAEGAAQAGEAGAEGAGAAAGAAGEKADGAAPEVIPQELLRKYVAYAKATVKPRLHQADLGKIQRVYADLRRESLTREGMPVAVRHVESIIRMAEAHALMHLRETVNDEDVNVAIGVMLRSFIATQKQALQKQLAKKFSKYTNYQRDFNHLLLDALRALLREKIAHDSVMEKHFRGGGSQGAAAPETVEVDLAQLEAKARDLGVLDLQPFLDSALFQANGFSVDAGRAKIAHLR